MTVGPSGAALDFVELRRRSMKEDIDIESWNQTNHSFIYLFIKAN
jgi:hypothetical protein